MTVKIDGTNTVANPAFTGADTDTGLQCGTDEVKLVTGGTARATVDSSGNVGIGASPHNNAGTNLHIHGSNTSAELRLTNTTTGTGANGSIIQQGGNTLYISNSENGATAFENNGSERMRVRSNGQVEFKNGSFADNIDCVLANSGTMEIGAQTEIKFRTQTNERMKIASDGTLRVVGVYNSTLASSANVHVDSGGLIRRVTSSAKYKTNIETIEDSYADALLNCRPVWYQSTCEGDNPDYGWWGFIAEEVAEIDPRLVHWKTTDVTHDEDGYAVETPCDPEAEGVLYDRFVPHLVNLVKRQKATIAAQQAQIDDLLARVTALEATE